MLSAGLNRKVGKMRVNHGILTARYAQPRPWFWFYPRNAQVIATRADGRVEIRYASDDIDGGGMTAFLADGGKIDPYEPPPRS
jgi:hypothetical protein